MGELSIRVQTNGTTGAAAAAQNFDATRTARPGLVDVTSLLPPGTTGPIYAQEATRDALVELAKDQAVAGFRVESDPAAITSSVKNFVFGPLSLKQAAGAIVDKATSTPDRNPI